MASELESAMGDNLDIKLNAVKYAGNDNRANCRHITERQISCGRTHQGWIEIEYIRVVRTSFGEKTK